MAVREVLTDARRGHPGLFWFSVTMAALAGALVVASVVDGRTLLGAPLWFKPLKFALSFMLYGAALAWMLAKLDRPGRRSQLAGWVIVAASGIEMVIIVGQAARGRRSHFNDDSAFDEMLFSIMGMTIAVLWLATLGIALQFFRRPGPDPATTWAVRLGLLIALTGMGLGMLMIGGDAHAVGVPDGGPGLALVGWSTTGGDLRIGHFIGMHALQILPLLAATLAAATRLNATIRLRLILVAAVGYAGLVALVTWQALRAQPLLAPDRPTIATFAALAIGVTVATIAVLAAGPKSRTSVMGPR
ncbi:MAG: hypothetical protein ACRDTG_11050 [Pseudonocardiaceae bacterium]